MKSFDQNTPTKRGSIEFLARYVIVGIINTAFSYGAYSLFIYLGLSYPVASFLALICGILWSFVTMGRLVFAVQLKGRFAKFILTWLALYLLNIALITIFKIYGFNDYTAGLIALPPVTLMAYIIQKKFVFSDKAI